MKSRGTINKKQLAVAYHEAGHAVISYWLNIPFKYVTIVVNEDALGHMKSWPMPTWFKPDIEMSPRIKDKLEKEIMVFLAGHVSEKKFTKHHNHIGASGDNQIAVDLALYFGGDEKTTTLLLKYLSSCVERQVDFKWKNIEAVAFALIDRKKLSKAEVSEILIPDLKSIYLKKIKKEN